MSVTLSVAGLALSIARIYLRMTDNADLADAVGDGEATFGHSLALLPGRKSQDREFADAIARALADELRAGGQYRSLNPEQQRSIAKGVSGLISENAGDLGWALKLEETDALTYLSAHGGIELSRNYLEFSAAFDDLLSATARVIDRTRPVPGRQAAFLRLFTSNTRVEAKLDLANESLSQLITAQETTHTVVDELLQAGGHLFGRLPRPMAFAIGRSELDDALVALAHPSSLVLLHGGVGMGKSYLAAQLLRRRERTATHTFSLWLRADSVEKLIGEYAAAAAAIGLTGSHSSELEETAGQLLDLLRRREGWLVVLDGVRGRLDELAEWLPVGRGSVLITSQVAAPTDQLANYDSFDHVLSIHVRNFSPDQSMSLLTTRLSLDAQDPRAGDLPALAEKLDGIPIALDAAARLLLKNPTLTPSVLLDNLEDGGKRIADVLPTEPTSPSLAALWSLAYESAMDTDGSGLARRLMSLALHLDPTHIPHAFWTADSCVEYLRDPFTKETPSRGAVLNALRHLADRSLIEITRGTRAGYRMHALPQRLLLESQSSEMRCETANVCANVLSEMWESPNLTFSEATEIRDNAYHLVLAGSSIPAQAAIDSALTSPVIHPLVYRLLDELVDAGRIDRPEQLYTGLLLSLDSEGVERSQDALRVRVELADILGERGRAREAVRELRGLCKQIGPIPDQPTECGDLGLKAWYRLARWEAKSSRYDEAEPLFRRLRRGYANACGADSGEYFKCSYQLARAEAELGRVDEAIRQLKKLIRQQERCGSASLRHIVKTKTELARWIGHSGDASAALKLLSRLADSYVELYGANGRSTLSFRRKLAYWSGKSGRAAVAWILNADLLDESIAVLGEEHKDTIRVSRNHAYWCGQAGYPHIAVSLMGDVVEKSARYLGDEHGETLAALRTKAVMLGDAGDPEAAVAALSAVLPAMERELGHDHLDTLDARRFLADWLGNSGSPWAAVGEHDEIIEALERVMDPRAPRVVVAKKNREKWRCRSGFPTEALSRLRLVADDVMSAHGLLHPQTYSVWEWQFEAIGTMGSPEKASQLFLRVADFMARKLGKGEVETILAHNAAFYWMSKTGPRGEHQALDGYDRLERRIRKLSITHPQIIQVRSNRAFCLGATGRTAAACELYEEICSEARDVWVPRHPEWLFLKSNHGRWLIEMDQDRAADLLTSTITEMVGDGVSPAVLESRHPQLLTAKGRLAYAHFRQGRKELAIDELHAVANDQARFLEPTHPKKQSTLETLRRWRDQ